MQVLARSDQLACSWSALDQARVTSGIAGIGKALAFRLHHDGAPAQYTALQAG